MVATGNGGAAAAPAAPSISLAAPTGDKSAERTMADAPSNAGKSRESSSVLTVEVVAGVDSAALPPTGAGSENPECSDEEKKNGTRCKLPVSVLTVEAVSNIERSVPSSAGAGSETPKTR